MEPLDITMYTQELLNSNTGTTRAFLQPNYELLSRVPFCLFIFW